MLRSQVVRGVAAAWPIAARVPLSSLHARHLTAATSRVAAGRLTRMHNRVAITHVLCRSFAQVTETVPGLGDSISEGTVVSWEKKVGDFVSPDETVCVLETDKVSVDIRATKAGKIVSHAADKDATVEVGAPLYVIETDAVGASAPAPKAAAAAAPAAPAAPKAAAAPPKAAAAPAPAAKAPAPAAKAPTPAAKPASSDSAAPPARKAVGSREERRVPISRMRLTIAKRLKDAQNTAAMLTTFNDVDMSALMNLRNKYKDEFLESHGSKLGFMSAFVKASAAALTRHPAVNGFFDADNKQTVYRDYVDVSVAVSTPTGLVVPVLRNCETMSFHDVESTIASLGKRARDGQLAMEDMAGGTFTISNGGVYGSLFGTPIINPPQSAILGMHGIFKRPIAVGDKVEIRPMMYVALTYDHRIIDGKDAVLFLNDIKHSIESPERMLLDL